MSREEDIQAVRQAMTDFGDALGRGDYGDGRRRPGQRAGIEERELRRRTRPSSGALERILEDIDFPGSPDHGRLPDLPHIDSESCSRCDGLVDRDGLALALGND